MKKSQLQLTVIAATFLLAFLLLGVVKPYLSNKGQSNNLNLETYRAEIAKIISEGEVPLIQLEYISPTENVSLQVENPAFYGPSQDDTTQAATQSATAQSATAQPATAQPATAQSPTAQPATLQQTTPQPAIFQAASLSKVVFAYIVMKMHENGEIDLDKPICEYTDINRFADKERAKLLTPRIVLNHRTGLPNWSKSPSSAEWPTSTIEFTFATDSCFGYSGEGFAFLQRAVEAIRGKDIDAIAKELVFDPLGMTHTSYNWLPIYDSLAVDGYNKEGENRGKGRHPRANVGYTLRTCAADYSKFIQALLNGTGMKPETFATMFETNSGPALRYRDNNRDCDQKIAWAMGIGTEDNANHGKILWHWGDNGSFKALFLVIPAEKKTLVYFTNSAHGHDIINPITTLFLKDTTPITVSDWINKK